MKKQDAHASCVITYLYKWETKISTIGEIDYMERVVGHGGTGTSVKPSNIKTTFFIEGRRAGSS